MARIVYKCGCESADYGAWECPEHGATPTLIETDFMAYGDEGGQKQIPVAPSGEGDR